MYPSSTSRSTAARNRTGRRTFSHQYAASSSGPRARPSRAVGYSGRPAARGAIPASASCSSASIGSIRTLWYGTSTSRNRAKTCSRSSRPASSPRMSRSPDSVTDAGLFTAATDTWSRYGRPSRSASSSDRFAASITPVPASRCWRALRASTIRTASSRPYTPAWWKAAISPVLCPTTASGRTPWCSHSAASPAWTAKLAGWASQVSAIRDSVSGRVSSSSSDQPAWRRTSRSQRSTASRNTGSASRSSRPMPHHCGPMPVNTHTSRGAPGSRRRPRTARGCCSPRSQAASTSSREPGGPRGEWTTARRSSKCWRRWARVCPRSARDTPAASSRRTPAASSAGPDACRALSGRTEREGVRAVARGSSGGRGGASSSRTWALVPPKPKELTPARAGPWCSGQSTGAVGISKGSAAKSMAGLGCSRFRCGGMRRCRRASAVLIRPATPAAASVCPMLVLTEPT